MREGLGRFLYEMSQYYECFLSLLFNLIATWMFEYLIVLFNFIFLSDAVLGFRGKDHHLFLKRI